MEPQERRMPSGLHDHTGYWLNRLRGLVHGGFEAALAGQGVTVAQWAVLVTIYRGDAVAPGDVARFVDIDAGAMTRLVDRLEAKGLLRRAPGEDRRSIRLELTPEARELVPRLSALADANDAAFFGALSAEEHAALRRLLGKLLSSHGVEPPAAHRDGVE